MVEQNINKAKILVEALPYIRQFHGQTIVIKYGGSVMTDQNLKEIFAKDIVLLKLVGLHPIVVHGGGKEISRWMERIGKKAEFIEGLRYTDAETMEVTEMVLSGKMNSELVSLINRAGGRAVGLSGKDASMFTARQIRGTKGQDLGFVGEVEATDTSAIKILSREGFIPVVSSVAETLEGQTLNLNADYAAASLAGALQALKLVYMTDVDGISIDGKLQTDIDLAQAEKLLNHPEVKEGMRPKLECSIQAIKEKVGHVQIINGGHEHAVLLELFTDGGVGTKISYRLRGQ